MIEFGEVVGEGAVRFERLFPGPIERVWAYVTESEKRGEWLAPGPMELRVGGAVELCFRHADLSPAVEETPEQFKRYEGHVLRGRVTLCEPPRRLAFTWDDDPADGSEVTFELTPRGDKVHLRLTHRRLADKAAMLSVSGGWHTHLAILSDNLDGRAARPFWATHAALEAAYRQRMGGP